MNIDKLTPGMFKQLDPARYGGLSEAEREAVARAVVARGLALIRRCDAAPESGFFVRKGRRF